MEIGKTYTYEGYFYTCIDILSNGDTFCDFGIQPNHGYLSKDGFPLVVAIWESRNSDVVWIDRFSHSTTILNRYLNANGTCRDLVEVSLPFLPNKVKQILEKKKMKKKDKKFVSVSVIDKVSHKIIACVDQSYNICAYDNEIIPLKWPTGPVTKERCVDIDITFEQYLQINGFKTKSKEDEIDEIQKSIVNLLGCQKEHLSPVLTAFIELLKQIKISKSTHMDIAVKSMVNILCNREEVHPDNDVKQISVLIRRIQTIL